MERAVCARHYTYILSFGSVYLAKSQRSGPQRGSPIHDRMALPFSNNRSRFTLGSVLILCTCTRCTPPLPPPPPTVRMAGPRVYSLYNSVLFLQHITPRVIRLFCRPVHVERWPAKRVYRRRRTRFLLSTSFEAQNWRKDKCRCSNSSRYTSRRNTRTKVREIFSYLFHDLYKFSQFDLFSSL